MRNAVEPVIRRAAKLMVNFADPAVYSKGRHADFVTEADVAVQDFLLNSLSRAFPEARFLAEEGEGQGLTDAFTFLKTAYVAVVDEAGEIVGYTGEIDLANSIYIDWGAFINAIINFLLIAFVLFCIVRVFNRLRDGQGKFADAMKSGRATKAERAEMKKLGMNPRNLEQLDSYRDAKAKEAAKAAEAEKAAAEAAAAEEAAKAAYAAAAPERQEALLREIVELLKNK